MGDETATLKKTPLNEVEQELGGKMVDFGGWELPVQYPGGILEEHQAVREHAGLFDVSHMGEVTVKGSDALALLQRATCNDVSKLDDGRAQYSGLLYPTGGFVDDLWVGRRAAADYILVVNASNADMAKGLDVEVRNVSDDYVLLALQGPESQRVLQTMTDADLTQIKYYRFAPATIDGARGMISRSGYTGEDGFEIFLSPDDG